ncbi:2Fe-2S ferredoxin-like [Rhopilema esculentum]|uniref:2Fe-2S ferredoxin-like n=1 Tax=Rhopilema esculentum TaxID=499914 RepID=UPI0031D8511C|eukprot:gene17634-9276_t
MAAFGRLVRVSRALVNAETIWKTTKQRKAIECLKTSGLSIPQSKRYFRSSMAVAKKTVSITFIDRDGDKNVVKANVGDTLLDVAKDNDIDLEGACEGTLACSTCHLVFQPEQYDKIDIDPPTEEELDMLDLAYGLTDTSRLGCQIEVTEQMDGLILTVPVSVDVRS